MRVPVLVLLAICLTAVAPLPLSAAGDVVLGQADAASVQDEPDLSDEDLLLEAAHRPWTGDLEGVLDRGFIRVATVNNPLYFSADGIDQRGLAVEVARELEKFLEKNFPKKGRHINVVLLPMAHDKVIPAVVEGRADIAAANLTITPERSEVVAFTEPTNTGVRELVVSGPSAPQVAGFDDLVATGLHIRRSSSYFEHMTAFNKARESEGKTAIPIEEMDEYLEDYDLLEMVNSGLLPAVIVDSHLAAIWGQVFTDIKVHDDLAINEGGEIAWVTRKESPELLAALNEFVGTIRKGSLLGNILIKRYVKNPKWIENVHSAEAMGRYDQTIDIIKRYAGDYDFDWLMITAQGYQESKLDQSKRSKVGAVGIMQVMPNTAKDPNVNIPDISGADDNVHAGVRYLRVLRDKYFDDPAISPLNQVLFSFAAYNAGPGNMNKARKRAEKLGLDPNVWFNNVEIGIAKSVSREPVIYVRNIYKYFVAYAQLERARSGRAAAEQ